MLNQFRHLFRVECPNGKPVAFVTATCEKRAVDTYTQAGGKVEQPKVYQLSYGYPRDYCQISF